MARTILAMLLATLAISGPAAADQPSLYDPDRSGLAQALRKSLLAPACGRRPAAWAEDLRQQILAEAAQAGMDDEDTAAFLTQMRDVVAEGLRHGEPVRWCAALARPGALAREDAMVRRWRSAQRPR